VAWLKIFCLRTRAIENYPQMHQYYKESKI
jgi:hypothetical protein